MLIHAGLKETQRKECLFLAGLPFKKGEIYIVLKIYKTVEFYVLFLKPYKKQQKNRMRPTSEMECRLSGHSRPKQNEHKATRKQKAYLFVLTNKLKICETKILEVNKD